MTQEQTPQLKPVSLFVNPSTFDLWERPASLFAVPLWISFTLNNVFQLLRHLDSAETYLLLKRVFDKLSAGDKNTHKAKFLNLRAKAIETFGEASLLEASKKLKAHPDRILEKAEADLVQDASKENLSLILPSAAPAQPLPTLGDRTPKPEAREAFRVPIADAEAVASCTTVITGILDEIRKSYVYNAPRLAQLAQELNGKSEISDDKLISAMLIAAGPLAWIKNKRPELAMQIRTLENVLEQSAIMGALGPTEIAGVAYLGYWQKSLREWQEQVDLFFPNVNQEGGETK